MQTLASSVASGIDLPSFPDAAESRFIRRRLLTWFDGHARDLPWRRTRDAYSIWVSEVMLQQTQAATVVRYFLPFLHSFPSVAALAAADEQQVLRHWQGLGYYRRARDLHRAARMIVERHGDQIPNDAEALAEIPGIGRYILGAVLSQAYERRLPILEANSRRVLSRLFALRTDPSRGPGERWLWQVAERLLPRRRVGDFNQALMELGALTCVPATPACTECPLAELCAARRLGLQAEIPIRAPVKEPVDVAEVAVAVRRQDKVLLVQRPSGGRWAGLWEFPRTPVPAGQTHEQTAKNWLRRRLGIQVRLGAELAVVKHAVTHHRITLVCLEAQYRAGACRLDYYPQAAWVAPADLFRYPVSSPQRRLNEIVKKQRQPGLF